MRTKKLSNSDVALLKRIEEVQSFLLGRKWAKSGQDFFEALAEYLAKTLGMDYVCIDRFLGEGLDAQTVAIYFDGKFEDNVRYTLMDTPCGKVKGEEVCFFQEGVRHIFPNDAVLQEMNAESYAGFTLHGTAGKPIGLIAVIGRKPLVDSQLTELVLKQVSIRAASELEHRNVLEEINRRDEQLRAIIESAMEGFWITDIHGHFLEVNNSYCRMSGYTLAELLTMNISEVVAVEMIQYIDLHIQNILKQGEERFEFKLRRKDGTTFNVEVSAYYRFLEGGQFVAFLHDITERKKVENALIQAKEDWERTFNAIPDLIAIVDKNHKIQRVNRAMADRLMCQQEHCLGLNCFQLMHNSDSPPEYCPHSKLISDGKTHEAEFFERHLAGDFLVTTTPLTDVNDQMVGSVHIARDITEQKKAAELLRKSEDKFRNLVRVMSVGVLLQGSKAEILLNNDKALELLGLDEDQLLGKTSFDPDWNVIREDGSPFPGNDHPVPQAIATGLSVREVVMGVYRPKKADRVWLLVDAEPQLDECNKVQQVICSFIDITKRIWAEESLSKLNANLENKVIARTAELITANIALQEAEDKYRTVADYTNNWETWLGPDGRLIYCSPFCFNVTGYSVDEFMNDPSLITNIAHPEDRFMVENHYNEEVKCVDKNWSFEFRIINCYGDERWISHSCRPIFNAEGKWIGQRGSNRDISEQKNAEKAMLASQQQLRALTKKMDALAEEERTRIAREIHDELGHLLTAMKFDIESITENEDLAPDSFKEKMDPILSMVDALIDSVRKIASDLRPGILDHLGLFPAIEWQINQFQMRTRIKCHYELKADIKFDKNETIIIYRILQEILTNVARHSKAKSLRISLVKSGSRFTMKVQDDGIGFDWNSDIYRNSFGLMGMRERAMSIGGELVIESFIGKGTTVIFELIIK